MRKNRTIELLAPAGTIDAFWAAAEAGADAIYVGLKHWNARAYARNFSIKECGYLVEWARHRNVKVYVALNSLIRPDELNDLTKTLKELSAINPDGLIIQDLGAFHAAINIIPHIPIHLSTLAGIHNLEGVKAAAKIGAKRVVLARELSVEEIISIASQSPVEVEVFIHGALCYSYSGFCMASSFRGGRSGLEGRCAQPCRLKFRQGKAEGFFLSCNDFSGIRFVPTLKNSPVAALKIEGRMKSAEYVAEVVKAYRMVLDAETPSEKAEKIKGAEEILASVPSRHQCSGYFSEDPSREILTPHRSGTSGKLIGTVKRKLKSDMMMVQVLSKIQIGDVIRPESSRHREEPIFKIKEMYSETGNKIAQASSGEIVYLEHTPDTPAGTKLFRIGSDYLNQKELWKKIKKECNKKSIRQLKENSSYSGTISVHELLSDKKSLLKKIGKNLILKVASTKELPAAFNSPAKWVILKASIANLKELANTRLIKAQKERIVLSLPSPFLGKQEWEAPVKWFVSKGFLLWEVNNLAHFEILERAAGDKEIGVIGGPRLNVKNACSMEFLSQLGCNWVTLSPEISKKELKELSKGPLPALPIVIVFHWIPLMVSRLKPKLMERKAFRSHRGDGYYYKRSGQFNLIFADSPVSWFEKISELEKMGYKLFEIDISEAPWSLHKDLPRLLSGYKRLRSDKPYSEFNWGR